MIGKGVKYYCKDDIEQIENYDIASISNVILYECHHKLGYLLNLSSDVLEKNNLYFKRPSYELIFLSIGDHKRLHNSRNSFFENPYSLEQQAEISETLLKIPRFNRDGFIKAVIDCDMYTIEAYISKYKDEI